MQINSSRQSPNHSSRDGHTVRLGLIHATVGGLASSLDWLCNPRTRVSTHYLISKTGVIYQLVAETRAAWHAGDAAWQGETAVNEISIGIELENLTGMDGFKGQDPYPAVQVDRLIELSRSLMERYPRFAFARHMDVALPKGRKSDPAGFAWGEFKARLNAPITKRYRVKRIMVSQRPEGGAPYAGELTPGEIVTIDKWYASSHTGHLADHRGFVLLDDLEAI
jgi:N-acetyl-anhydromuramyl-L-alanine amidase AmpD